MRRFTGEIAPTELFCFLDSHTVFFDIGDTLGSPLISPPPFRLEGLDVYPFVKGVLEELRSVGARLGIISNTGNETSASMERVLREAGLFDFFDPDLLIYSSVVGLEKNSPAIFQLASQRAGHAASPNKCLFVGEDRRERQYALQAGFKVSPHPLTRDRYLLRDDLAASTGFLSDMGQSARFIEDAENDRLLLSTSRDGGQGAWRSFSGSLPF